MQNNKSLKLKKLPIGVYTLKKIIEGNYLYIDKSDIAFNIIENNQYVFLSRPRRFGKSLFLDTLKEIFEGNKELFKGLYIYDKWNFNKKHPIIKISFANGKVKTREELDKKIITILKESQKNLGIDCDDENSVTACFRDLIIKANQKYNEKVVILIDEYDKPILDNIENSEVASDMREGLASFYSVIKGSDEFLRFAFLTGVSKFSKTSIFSGLNNITDITLNPKYGDICGYTQNDIETLFLPYLAGVDLEKLKSWYNGYNFLKSKVYNPYNILLFIENKHLYKNYWFETGTPTFLIKLIKENNYFLPELSNLRAGEELLNSFDVENIKIETLLFQTGYLTIDKQEEIFGNISYTLKYPNIEVKTSLNKYLFDYLSNTHIGKHQVSFYYAIKDNKISDIEKNIFSLFAAIPNDNYRKNNISYYEGFYASVLYAYFAGMGIEFIAEDVTNKGCIDMSLFFEDRAYIIEFKVLNSTPKVNLSPNPSPEREGSSNMNSALEQIIRKKYHEKYSHKYNKIYQIGIIFNQKERNIVKFDYELVKK